MKLTTENIWFTSDTHYNHKNIVHGETNWRNADGEIPVNSVRPFQTVEEMNDQMVNGINDLVMPNDWLIHLGDWSVWWGDHDYAKEFRERINCNNIVLILGNHDYNIRKSEKHRSMFSHVADYEELRVTRDEKEVFVLSHYPMISWNGFYRGAYMLHGHQHLKGDRRFCNRENRRMDVGFCGSPEFRPYHVEEILELLKPKTNGHELP
jgi:calcineurin-like phosphoesterase family protein